ncbi:hypothetical protein D9M68_579140 [compost metagenome]
MKKRAFLMPLATLAAVFSTNQASATVEAPSAPLVEGHAGQHVQQLTNQADQETVQVKAGGDQFQFLLQRGEGGQLMAYHSSHSSHASHASHASHSSHYSGS